MLDFFTDRFASNFFIFSSLILREQVITRAGGMDVAVTVESARTLYEADTRNP